MVDPSPSFDSEHTSSRALPPDLARAFSVPLTQLTTSCMDWSPLVFRASLLKLYKVLLREVDLDTVLDLDFHLNDYILELDKKMFPSPQCMLCCVCSFI
jgi:hypothetical protein